MIDRKISKETLKHLLYDFKKAQPRVNGRAIYPDEITTAYLVDFVNWWEDFNRRLLYLSNIDLAKLNPEFPFFTNTVPYGWQMFYKPTLIKKADSYD